MAETGNRGRWLLFAVAVAFAVLSPIWLPHFWACTSGKAPVGSTTSYIVAAMSWCGVILMGAPPFYTVATRFAFLDNEAIEDEIKKHNKSVAEATGKPLPANDTAVHNAWRIAIDAISKKQWKFMITGFTLVVASGLFDLLVKAKAAACP